MNTVVKLGTGKGKTGKDYNYIEVTIGAYQGRLFPSPAEFEYLKSLRDRKARDDFQESMREDEE